jgi:hypothetical protein
MNPPDIDPLTRGADVGLNAAREIAPDADYAAVALAAYLMNNGLLTAEQFREHVMRARAVPLR